MKILSPVGNMDSLKTAIYNGANEVYLGVNDFNARNNIDGFCMDNLQNAVDFAHLYGVKVCLAINILFNDEELEKALNIVIDAYQMGVDYFIIQDLGLAKILSDNYPEITIHASTQMGIHNLEGVRFIEQFGFKRVVLARETPLSEIKRIRENSNIEIEYFVHGALCVSFSGNCYLSSYLFNASGNRGRCKQLCRLPYTLENKGKKIKRGYLLSAKDFNMSNRLKELEFAGVDVLKIEGRARRPSYVGMVTREYYNALNGLSVEQDNIRLAFNREFTAGYFDGNDNIISKYNNHIGIAVGKVERVNNGKNFNQVYFTSDRKLFAKSTFKLFYNGEEKNTLTAYDLAELGDGKYMLTTTQKVEKNSEVRLILATEIENGVINTATKRDVKISISVKVGVPITATFTLNGKEYKVLGDSLLPAEKRPLTTAEIIDNFAKSEYFNCQIDFKVFDLVFMAKSRLNEFRRNVYSTLIKEITAECKKSVQRLKLPYKNKVVPFTDFEIIDGLDREINCKNVIYSPEIYDVEDIKLFMEKCAKLNAIAYLDTPNFALKEDVKHLEKIIKETGIKIVANNYYALTLNAEMVIGAGLNVYNTATATAFGKEFITAESNIGEKIDFAYMTLRHCPIKSHVGGSCVDCKYNGDYNYVMDSGKVLKLKRKKLHTCTFYLTD